MKKTKMEKGITLIALILTIIILLILAVVALNAVNNTEIITKAEGAADKYTIEQEKEQIQLAQNEWILNKYSGTSQTFEGFISGSKLSEKAEITPGNAGSVIVTYTATGNQYTVTEGGEITTVEKGISLQDTNLALELNGESGKIAVTLTGGLKETETEKIEYTSSDPNVATVDAEGNVTPVAAGEATITVTFGSYSKTYTVTVGEAEPEVISIAGKYGVVTENSYAYYWEFEAESIEEGIERGTIKFVHWGGSGSNEGLQEDSGMGYRYEDGNIIYFETGKENQEEYPFPYPFEAKLDADGKVINKVLYGEVQTETWEGQNYNGTVINNYYEILTTSGTAGFEKLSNNTYEVLDSTEFTSVEFKSDGSLVLSGENNNYTVNDHFVLNGIVYTPVEGSEFPGHYEEFFVIFNDSHVGYIAGS